jgi:hypothetical protein
MLQSPDGSQVPEHFHLKLQLHAAALAVAQPGALELPVSSRRFPFPIRPPHLTQHAARRLLERFSVHGCRWIRGK